jgi:hypothetical protein
MEISGNNFECTKGDPECKKLKVRFTNERNEEIIEDGNFTKDGTVKCYIPRYPAPETLAVDVSFNG